MQETAWLELDGKQFHARFSPDGDWVAYTSDEVDGSQVFVESFPDRSERFRVSNDDGGRYPEWRADGREIYYVSSSRVMMAVPVDMEATDHRPIGTPEALFPAHLRQGAHYDVNDEGDRFLLNRFVGEAAVPSAVLVRGWRPDDAEWMAGQ
jgi:hypothetical protein